ncbi:MAG TPA: hypothetical protein VEB63_03925 [Chitinophagaceae bacterium]|nr:hypothetical protein [Chitinophagaceae bacterium]
MKTVLRCFSGLAVSVTGLVLYLLGHIRQKTEAMLSRISDEGYETAYDILYPGEESNDNLHYGPVIPE